MPRLPSHTPTPYNTVMKCAVLIPFLALMACAQFPQLDARVDAAEQSAPPPPLLTADQLVSHTPQTTVAPPSAAPGRLAALRARAGRLRGPVIDPATRARMARGVSNPF